MSRKYFKQQATKNMDDFFQLTKKETPRHKEILENIAMLKNLYKDDTEGWISASLNRISRNYCESIFITYVFGSILRTEQLN